jgi:hypothetical protein
MAEPHLDRHIRPPSAIGLLRPRLVSEPDSHTSPRLKLAVGPPGSGKTTLLRQWAAQGLGTVAWYPSSRLEAQPGEMLSWFARALATATESEPATAFPALDEATQLLVQQHYFVVDDFQLLAGTCAEAELEQLIALNSPHLHFLIGSRHLPHINMAKSELRNAFTVSGDDLRFRENEIDQLFRNTFQRPLSVHGISNLAHVTDGWAAALHLFHLATMNRSNVERRRAAESLSARSRFAEEYLLHHFLAGVTPDMNQLLSVTSLLDFITPSRCDTLLERHDSRAVLQRLEQLGIISTDDDGATYRMPTVLRQLLLLGFDEMEPDEQVGVRRRTAALLGQEGAVGEGLRILAEGRDWESVKLLLARAGESAVQPGTCGWAASIPDNAMPDNAWILVARAREMLDDGRAAAAECAAARVMDLTTDAGCLRRAEEFRLQAGLWSRGTEAHFAEAPSWEFRKAILGDPCAAARLLGERHQPENLLTGLSLLLAGNQRSALPLLIQCAERLDRDPASALAAQLALAVFGRGFDGTDADATAAEVDSVQRQAARRGFTWLGRLAGGIQAALSRTPASLKPARTGATNGALRSSPQVQPCCGYGPAPRILGSSRHWPNVSDGFPPAHLRPGHAPPRHWPPQTSTYLVLLRTRSQPKLSPEQRRYPARLPSPMRQWRSRSRMNTRI